MKPSKWDQRVQRAAELEAVYPFAAEVLQFYRHLAEFQRKLYSSFEEINGNGSVRRVSRLSDEDLKLHFLLPKFRDFLSRMEAISPGPLAESARQLGREQSSRWEELLSNYWASEIHSDVCDAQSLLARAFVQPYAESVADHAECANHDATSAICPFCCSKPLLGVLRPEGDGAKRSLVCSLCMTEWNYGRIRCAACGEEAVEKLAVYTSDQFGHVRVEGCDSCRNYIKTIDMTKNGLAVPIVDELATMPLNLWAQEHHYVKVQPNLLGI
ncbi:MAG TPA: formate dehydrogenase accessory protein FdhE [Terriglobales bacterium]|nr:formate dehydrogenase accessory protein FdhE [Terriglobales bacterium]